jgi:hypothetical protein
MRANINLAEIGVICGHGSPPFNGLSPELPLANPQREDRVITCKVTGKECKTLEEFNALVGPYINN